MLQRTGVDASREEERKFGFFSAGHTRDGNGRLRILSDGDTKSFVEELRIYSG